MWGLDQGGGGLDCPELGEGGSLGGEVVPWGFLRPALKNYVSGGPLG